MFSRATGLASDTCKSIIVITCVSGMQIYDCLYLLHSIIAVSYEARDFGVTRNMRGDKAKEKCPEITLVRVPEARGKANLTLYREAGAEVIAVLSRFCDHCERASVDEAYLDLTENVKM